MAGSPKTRSTAKSPRSKTRPLTKAERDKLEESVVKSMIKGFRRGLTLTDHIHLFLGTMSVMYSETRIRLRVA
jgi:hypothetical protein